MLKISNSKKFGLKKNFVQYKLAKFLNWRETSKIQFERDTAFSGKPIYLKKTKKYPRILDPFKKQNSLSQIPVNTILSIQTNEKEYPPFQTRDVFFPEKKNFMQFWTLPLLGACFLSILTFQKENFLNKKNEPLRKTIFSSVETPFVKQKVTKKLFRPSNICDLKPFSKISSSLAQYSSKSSKKIINSNKPSLHLDLENLCLFYLNLTTQKQKLAQMDQPGDSYETILLNTFYFQKGRLNWKFYPLNYISSGELKQSQEGFLREPTPRFLFLEKSNFGISSFSQERKRFIFDEFKEWKERNIPHLSYFEAIKFFENWKKNRMVENPKLNLILEEKGSDSFEINLEKSSPLLFSFSKLFEKFTQNKNNLAKIYLDLLPAISNEFVSTPEVPCFSSRARDGHEVTNRDRKMKIGQQQQLNNILKNFKKNFLKTFATKYELSMSKKIFKGKQVFTFQNTKFLGIRSVLKNQLLRSKSFKNLNQSKFVPYSSGTLIAQLDVLELERSSGCASEAREANGASETRAEKSREKLRKLCYDLFFLKQFENKIPADLSIRLNSSDIGWSLNRKLENETGQRKQKIVLYRQFSEILKNVMNDNVFKISFTNSSKTNDTIMKLKLPLMFSDLSNLKKNSIPMIIFNNGKSLELQSKETSLFKNSLGCNIKASQFPKTKNVSVSMSSPTPFISNTLLWIKKLQQFKSWLNNEFFLLQTSQKKFETVLWRAFLENVPLSYLNSNQSPKIVGFKNKNKFQTAYRHQLKTKNLLTFKLAHKNQLKNRKSEKIFRTFLSIKKNPRFESYLQTNVKFLKKEEKTLEKIHLILNKLKRRSQIRNFNSNVLLELKKKRTVHISSKSLFLKNIGKFSFLKRADFFKNSLESKMIEKKKNLEKKRRLKKLKLENRRRKKRKRFYPRPHFLRFQIYSNFLKKRHRNLITNKKFQSSNLIENQNRMHLKYTGNLKARSFYANLYSNGIWGKTSNTEKLLFKNYSRQMLELKRQNYHQKEFYKISNETLTEFERLCWKSYWLRSNLKPYISKIQKNLRRMKEVETLKNSTSLFCQLWQNLIFSGFNPGSKLTLSESYPLGSKASKNEKTLTLAPAYLNIKESFNISTFQNVNFHFFKQIENQNAYDRLIYERITDEIKNVKSQLTVEGQSQARSYKTGRQKLERGLTSKPLFNDFSSFQTNFLEPKIDSIISLGSFKNTKSQIPFGNLPTLRLLWACHKTNLFTYQKNHFSKSLWSTYKNREQTKNNQTRKFLYRLFRFSPIENFQSVQTKFKQDLSNSSSQNFQAIEMPEKKIKLQKLSTTKLKGVRAKLQTFGDFTLGKNYYPYLRHLKFKLHSNPVSKFQLLEKQDTFPKIADPLNKKHFKNRNKIESFFLGSDLNNFRNPWFETSLENFIQKRSFHFWWSLQKPTIELPFLIGSPFLFSTPTSYLENNINSFQWLKVMNLNNSESSVLTSGTEQYNKNFIMVSFWTCSCVFHLGIFFALIRIPEIRGLVKFQILIFSKLVSAYFIGIFAIYNLLKNYKIKLQNVWVKISKIAVIHEIPLNFEKTMQSDSTKRVQKNLNKNHFFSFPKKIQTTFHFQFLFRLFLKYPTVSFSTINFRKPFHESASPFQEISKNADGLGVVTSTAFSSVDGINIVPKSNAKNQISQYISWSSGFFWYIFSKSFDNQKFLNFKKANTNLNILDKKIVGSKQLLNTSPAKKNVIIGSGKVQFASVNQRTLQLQSFLSLLIFSATRLSFSSFYICFGLFYKVLFQIIDILEGTLFIFYKFLEKPAEVMVDWIAEIFLIEWTSDMNSYIPEAFETAGWTSFTKFSRSTRFFYSLPFGFMTQRFLFESAQLFYQSILKRESDLLTRQKKGVIFWDIWTEILIQAAETYKMNLSSLSTIKEEQELLMENLLEQKNLSPASEKFSKGFLNSHSLQQSLTTTNPLLKFTNDQPSSFGKQNSSAISFDSAFPISFKKTINLKPNSLPFQKSLLDLLKKQGKGLELQKIQEASQFFDTRNNNLRRWSANQYLNIQGKDTDLFMDIHPPKSFSHVRFLKSYLPAQEVLGSLVCEIYAGLFSSKVSKNVLVVGAPGIAKSFFIQALAGESELKIVIDNSHRYAFVNGGVPVGMKLLRDVFDAIALHTPCLFLLEDVHIIGERRPMLISDDEISKTKDSTFGSEQEEVHENNKRIYELSKHAISHYKKPYKGDFSLALPTHHFCYDLFLGTNPVRKRRSDMTAPSPLPISKIEETLDPSVAKPKTNFSTSFNKATRKAQNLFSSLQISIEQVFAPPATSPFHILLMKEKKKLKPKKQVKEVPWSGLSYDQWMLLPKTNYSVRTKVALLAEIAMKNLSVKLDMITDLLVIIDSVRANRGFVVFATTHVPALLDPALRRPGRLDETIALPLLPNIQTRFEILKTSLTSYTETLDFLDYSVLTSQFHEREMASFINKTRLLLFNTKKMQKTSKQNTDANPFIFPTFFNDYLISSISKGFNSLMSLDSLWIEPNKLKKVVKLSIMPNSEELPLSIFGNRSFFLRESKTNFKSYSFNYVALSYAQAGQFLTEALLINDQTTYTSKFFNASFSNTSFFSSQDQRFMFQAFYAGKAETQQTLLKLFAGQISQFFVFQASRPVFISSDFSTDNVSFGNMLENSLNFGIGQTNPSSGNTFNNFQNSINYWQSATAFLDTFFQKRYLYNKNSIVSKMLLFENQTRLAEPPSPPNSSILMPAKKFENYKRTFKDFIQKPSFSIQEKLQLHQKQRFLKLLYNIPIQTSFPNLPVAKQAKGGSSTPSLYKEDLRKLEHTNFYSAFKELAYLDCAALKPSATSIFYKKHFLTRQRFSFLNQWWNGQLAEHNSETTYLSHIDWRSIFVPAAPPRAKLEVKPELEELRSSSRFASGARNDNKEEISTMAAETDIFENSGDIFIDFPDAEQYYNPRLRRWFLQSQSWSYWLNFETELRQQISEHFILESFTKISLLFHSNREILDDLAFRFLRNHQLHEVDLIQSLVRFYKT